MIDNFIRGIVKNHPEIKLSILPKFENFVKNESKPEKAGGYLIRVLARGWGYGPTSFWNLFAVGLPH